ncbi:MAG: hypothetical protein BWY77_01769 [bacterium ADurb.Bin431]|nr:MAG: hypothetical protein BWY77_01769 [bacterium ADurb.Bin431]
MVLPGRLLGRFPPPQLRPDFFFLGLLQAVSQSGYFLINARQLAIKLLAGELHMFPHRRYLRLQAGNLEAVDGLLNPFIFHEQLAQFQLLLRQPPGPPGDHDGGRTQGILLACLMLLPDPAVLLLPPPHFITCGQVCFISGLQRFIKGECLFFQQEEPVPQLIEIREGV